MGHYTHLLSLLFWIAFLVPGLALLRRWDRSLCEAGILPTVSLSFLASLAAVSPIAVLGYIVGLPVVVLSICIVGFILWGCFDLFVKAKAGKELLGLLKGFLVLEALLLAFVFFVSSRVGSKLGADALIHMARVRQFLDHGLTNVDPFVTGDHFYGIYHTNLFHALQASCSQVTGVDHMGVWMAFLPFANLLIAGGIATLAYRIFPKQWIGWLAAVFFLADQGAVDFLTYPNKLAPFFLIPILVSFVIQALRDRPTWKHAIQIMAVSVVIAQFHGMYAVFICVLVGPTLLGFAAYHFFRRRESPMPWIWLGLAVLCALPWPAVSKLDEIKTERESRLLKIARDADPNSVEATSGTRAPTTAQDPIRDKFLFFTNGWLMKDPLRGWGGGRGFFDIPGYRYQLLILGLIAAWFSTRRREVLLGCCALLSCAAFLYIAPLCTLLLWIVEAEWILLRLETAGFPVLFPAIAMGGFAWQLSRIVTHRALQSVLVFLALPLAFDYSGQANIDLVPFSVKFKADQYTWKTYLDLSSQNTEYLTRELQSLRRNRFFLEDSLQGRKGLTLLCRDTRAMEAVMLYDCHILGPIRSCTGVPGLSYLRKINRMLINERSDWELRRRLLREYGVHFYLLQGNPRWIEGHIKVRDGKKQIFQDLEQPDWRMVELDLDN